VLEPFKKGEIVRRARRTIGRGSGERLACSDEDARAQVTSNFWTEEVRSLPDFAPGENYACSAGFFSFSEPVTAGLVEGRCDTAEADAQPGGVPPKYW